MTDAFGPTRLFRNRRDGTFEEITASSGIVTSGPTRSLAFADVNGDGNLDLFVCGTGDYYGQMPDPPFDANDGRRNTSSSATERAISATPPRNGASRSPRAGRFRASSRTSTGTGGRT